MYALLIQTEHFKHLIKKEQNEFVVKYLTNERIEELFSSFEQYKKIYLTTPIVGVAAFVKQRQEDKYQILENQDSKQGEKEFVKWIEEKSTNL